MFIYAFMLSMFFGIVAKKTEFCPLGGIADVVDTGNTGRLRMYFFSIATAIIGITLLETFGQLDLDGSRLSVKLRDMLSAVSWSVSAAYSEWAVH